MATPKKETNMKCNIKKAVKEEQTGDPRLMEIVKNLDNLLIGPDEPFKFHCTMCGQCCIHREDIILTPKDLFQIAQELGKTPADIVKEHCDCYIGHTSRIPIVRLKPVGYDKHCPLLNGNKCSVHKVKPVVCAMFPIGRVVSAVGDEMKANDITPDKVQYIFTKPGCGDDAETHTVREWFGEFGIPMQDEFFIQWQRMINALSVSVHEVESKLKPDQMNKIWDLMFTMTYLNYEMDRDFYEQFIKNTEFIDFMEKLAKSEVDKKCEES